MMDSLSAQPPAPDDEQSADDKRTHLAYARSGEAAERTLMAVVRTALSMITFGFTIAKFLGYLATSPMFHIKGRMAEQPHLLGLILLLGGTASLVLGLVEYMRHMRRLSQGTHRRMYASTALFVAIFVLLAGIFGTIELIFNVVPVL